MLCKPHMSSISKARGRKRCTRRSTLGSQVPPPRAPAQKAMNLSEAQHASLRDARRQLLTQTQTLRRQRAHLLQQLNTPLPGDSDVLNTEALSQVNLHHVVDVPMR